jgi:predicted NBD/HSP70 family sugar kinase
VSDAERARPETVDALDGVADHLIQALVATVHLLDPDTVVLGGWLAAVTPWLAPRMGAALDARVLGARWAAPSVVASRLGPDAALWGAALTSARHLLGDPVLRARPRRERDHHPRDTAPVPADTP